MACPEIRAVAQNAGMGQLVQQDVVNQFPRQLHQIEIEHDVGLS